MVVRVNMVENRKSAASHYFDTRTGELLAASLEEQRRLREEQYLRELEAQSRAMVFTKAEAIEANERIIEKFNIKVKKLKSQEEKIKSKIDELKVLQQNQLQERVMLNDTRQELESILNSLNAQKKKTFSQSAKILAKFIELKRLEKIRDKGKLKTDKQIGRLHELREYLQDQILPESQIVDIFERIQVCQHSIDAITLEKKKTEKKLSRAAVILKECQQKQQRVRKNRGAIRRRIQAIKEQTEVDYNKKQNLFKQYQERKINAIREQKVERETFFLSVTKKEFEVLNRFRPKARIELKKIIGNSALSQDDMVFVKELGNMVEGAKDFDSFLLVINNKNNGFVLQSGVQNLKSFFEHQKLGDNKSKKTFLKENQKKKGLWSNIKAFLNLYSRKKNLTEDKNMTQKNKKTKKNVKSKTSNKKTTKRSF